MSLYTGIPHLDSERWIEYEPGVWVCEDDKSVFYVKTVINVEAYKPDPDVVCLSPPKKDQPILICSSSDFK
jgi:hypothetical protein